MPWSTFADNNSAKHRALSLRCLKRVKSAPHSVLMCPHLHAFCGICKLCGHMEQEHRGFGLEKSPLQLRNDFKEFCHLGKFTSIPFLYNFGNVKSHHWKTSLGGNSLYRGQGDLWMYGGLNATLPDEMLQLKLQDRERAERNLLSTPNSYERAAMQKARKDV